MTTIEDTVAAVIRMLDRWDRAKQAQEMKTTESTKQKETPPAPGSTEEKEGREQ